MKIITYIANLMLIVIGIASYGSNVSAATRTAASCSQTDIQSAINSASNGDIVQVPAGSCSWSGTVSWTNKNVTVMGAGKDKTSINCGACFTVTSTASDSTYSKFRISGMTLNGSSGGPLIKINDNVASPHSGWRVDNMKLYYPTGSGYGIFVAGATWGLIDHNDFNLGNMLNIINVGQMSTEWPASASKPYGGYIESLPLDMGTANALYIENNTFLSTAPGGCAAYDTSSGGGRAVFRYNTVTGCMYYSHWTRDVEIGGILHEIYNNKFVGTSALNGNPIRLEAGTGVIFNNTVSGFQSTNTVLDERRAFYENGGAFGACDGTKSWDGNAGDPSAPGWPCLGQIGRGPGKTMAQITGGSKQISVPLYFWNNGSQDGCAAGGTCTNSMSVDVWDGSTKAKAYIKATPHPNGEVDYVLNGSTPKPGYIAYAYPHPLQAGGNVSTPPSGGGSSTTLSSPANLKIVP